MTYLVLLLFYFYENMLNSLKDFLVRNYIPYQNAKIGKTYGNQPVSIAYWLDKRQLLKRYSSKKDVLIASKRVLKTHGKNLPIEELKELLSGTILGDWALDKDTIILLWERLIAEKPRIIIESGSGTSTLINAYYMQKYCPEGKIISLEQQKDEKVRVDNKLRKFGLSPFAYVLYAPLDENDHYGVNHEYVEQLLGNEKADWLVIDGPSGRAGCRSAVMDTMLPYLKSGARWFADDAFRDGELEFLQKWQQSEEIIVEGIFPVGKGLATGIIN